MEFHLCSELHTSPRGRDFFSVTQGPTRQWQSHGWNLRVHLWTCHRRMTGSVSGGSGLSLKLGLTQLHNNEEWKRISDCYSVTSSEVFLEFVAKMVTKRGKKRKIPMYHVECWVFFGTPCHSFTKKNSLLFSHSCFRNPFFEPLPEKHLVLRMSLQSGPSCLIGQPPWGLSVGKLRADLCFWGPVSPMSSMGYSLCDDIFNLSLSMLNYLKAESPLIEAGYPPL